MRGDRARGPRVRRLALVTVLAATASLANPNGLDGALYPLQQLQMIGPADARGALGRVIIELTPLFNEHRPLDPVAMALFLALAGLSAGAMLLNRHRLGHDPLLWLAFLVLALGAQRNLALFAIVAAPILVRNTNDLLDARGGVAPGIRRAAAAAASVALCVLAADAARGGFFERIGAHRSPGIEVMEGVQPVGAAEWIARERPPGPIAHDMADGGYFIWRLYPAYPVMLDGRLEVFGARRFTELMLSDVEGFQELNAKYRFGVVVLRYASGEADALLSWLHLNSNWSLVHVDDLSAVFVRAPAGGAPLWPDLDPDAADLFPPARAADRAVERARFLGRTRFYVLLHRFARALAVWEEALARHPDIKDGRFQHALLLLQNGRVAEAEPLLVETVAREPERADARTYLADVRRRAGDLVEARTLYEAALEIDPSQLRAVLGLARVHEAFGLPGAAIPLYVHVVAHAQPHSVKTRDHPGAVAASAEAAVCAEHEIVVTRVNDQVVHKALGIRSLRLALAVADGEGEDARALRRLNGPSERAGVGGIRGFVRPIATPSCA